MTDSTQNSKPENKATEPARKRRPDYQRGLLHIPQDRLPSNRHHRFIHYRGEDMARARSLGYEPVSLKNPDYKSLMSFIGDGVAADGHMREGDYIVITKGQSKLILVECPLELWEQAKKEKVATTNELESRYNKKQGQGFKDSSLTQQTDTKPI
jgi:hypothetical protein